MCLNNASLRYIYMNINYCGACVVHICSNNRIDILCKSATISLQRRPSHSSFYHPSTVLPHHGFGSDPSHQRALPRAVHEPDRPHRGQSPRAARRDRHAGREWINHHPSQPCTYHLPRVRRGSPFPLIPHTTYSGWGRAISHLLPNYYFSNRSFCVHR